MPYQQQRQAWVLSASDAGQIVEIVDDALKVGNQGWFTLGAPMSEVIVGIDDGAVLIEDGGDVPVPSAVLGIAVDQLDDALSLTRWIPATEEHPALCTVKLRFEHQ
jgi:hypothetical protein